MIDPVCVFHGKRRSEHICLYCCLCFKDLTIEECHQLPDGSREDVCMDCVEGEAWALNHFDPARLLEILTRGRARNERAETRAKR